LETLDVKGAMVAGRTKTLESFCKKIHRKGYHAPLEQMTDLAGVRIVCHYESDLAAMREMILSAFKAVEFLDKNIELGVDKMGYHGLHLVVVLGEGYKGAHYEGLTDLMCEIQIRTVLQDAWALINHHLVYKNEDFIPQKIRRDLNNVASLLEIAQGVFDSMKERREQYLSEIEEKQRDASAFLLQPIDYDTVMAYTKWKHPALPVSKMWQTQMLSDMNMDNYETLQDIDTVVEKARSAVEAYSHEVPHLFQFGTDFLTKSLGFIDHDFREKHFWTETTRIAFDKFSYLIRKKEAP
jgi:ppGpp synthetase/RelA/SpoT-type nucleotidyltranferase